MKALTTQKIDGFDIITRVCPAEGFIDPEETKKIVNVEIEKTDAWKDIETIKNQMQTYAHQAMQAKRNTGSARTESERTKFWDEYRGRVAQMAELQDQLKPLAVNLKSKQKDLIMGHARYFKPRDGEEIIDDKYAEKVEMKMIKATSGGNLIDKNLDEIVNHKGKKFWNKVSGKWNKTEIYKIGVNSPVGAMEENELDEEEKAEITVQMETERITALSIVEKETEKSNALAVLLGRATMMRSELEILGDPDALKKSQEWLADETILVEEKYA